jgi:hypothetical protein
MTKIEMSGRYKINWIISKKEMIGIRKKIQNIDRGKEKYLRCAEKCPF